MHQLKLNQRTDENAARLKLYVSFLTDLLASFSSFLANVFFLSGFTHVFLLLVTNLSKNSGSRIFSDQLSSSQTLKHSPYFTLESKGYTCLPISAHNKECVSIKITKFIMQTANESNTFNYITEEYQHHSYLLKLPISYVKHYFKFFSLTFNHFSLKAHLPISMNNNFMKKMYKFNENAQVLTYNFFILGFFFFYEIKFLMNKLKANEKKKTENILIFVMFFMNSYQIYNENNLTLTIKNSNEFNEISQYKNIVKYIIISENIYSIPSGSFSGWPSVVSVDFGNSVSSIGGYAFSSCSKLVTIIIGENVTEIGGGAFSFCSSIKNITIPNSVTTIGSYAFSSCSNLTLLTLGYGIKNIGSSAFGNCYNLQCIYYYGDSEPEIGESAFSNVFTSVITYPTYVGSKFGNLNVAKDNTEGTCEPLPTHSFNQSNTFTASLQSDISISFSYTLTITLSITHSLTIYETQTKTFSLYINNSTFSYIETEFIYYNYTIVIYSTYYNYYSNFFTMFYTSNENSPNGITTNALIGIICGSFAFVLIIVGIVIFLVKSNNKKEKSNSKLQFKDTTTSSTKQIEEVNSLVEDIVKEDEDNWL